MKEGGGEISKKWDMNVHACYGTYFYLIKSETCIRSNNRTMNNELSELLIFLN